MLPCVLARRFQALLLQGFVLLGIDFSSLHHSENVLFPLEALAENLRVRLILAHYLVQGLQTKEIRVLVGVSLLQRFLLLGRTNGLFFGVGVGSSFRLDFYDLLVIDGHFEVVIVVTIEELHVNIAVAVFFLLDLLALLEQLKALLLVLYCQLSARYYILEPLI